MLSTALSGPAMVKRDAAAVPKATEGRRAAAVVTDLGVLDALARWCKATGWRSTTTCRPCRRSGPLRDFTATTTNTTYAGDITYSAVLVELRGPRSTEAARRAGDHPPDVDELPDQTPLFAFGTPAQIVDRLGSLPGRVQWVYLLDLTDSTIWNWMVGRSRTNYGVTETSTC